MKAYRVGPGRTRRDLHMRQYEAYFDAITASSFNAADKALYERLLAEA